MKYHIFGISAESVQTFNAKFSEDDLRSRLTPEEYHVTQEKGTERYIVLGEGFH